MNYNKLTRENLRYMLKERAYTLPTAIALDLLQDCDEYEAQAQGWETSKLQGTMTIKELESLCAKSPLPLKVCIKAHALGILRSDVGYVHEILRSTKLGPMAVVRTEESVNRVGWAAAEEQLWPLSDISLPESTGV